MEEKNPERKLTPAEEKRLRAFNAKAEELAALGYTRRDLTVSPKSANVKGVIYGFLPTIPFIVLYFIIYKWDSFRADENYFLHYFIFIAALIALVVLHELIHGFFWGVFAKDHFKSIGFGVLWRSLNPYCTCSQPLTKAQYLIGSLMPGFLLGIVPCVIAFVIHSGWLLIMGVIMTASAGGDILVSLLLLGHKGGKDVLYYDHPTAIGLVAFEKE